MITSGEATSNGLFVVVAHSNKHIRHAIRFAVRRGWFVIKAGPRAHIWGACSARIGNEMAAGFE
jgi:hypothetical protein